jgi:hypothetical protein
LDNVPSAIAEDTHVVAASVSRADRGILRRLAARVAGLAHRVVVKWPWDTPWAAQTGADHHGRRCDGVGDEATAGRGWGVGASGGAEGVEEARLRVLGVVPGSVPMA